MEIKQVFPLFEEGRILKRDSLDLMRDYAPDFFSLLFREYGNGVVTGFSVRGDGKDLVVSPGILKHGASFFCMKEEARLEFCMYGQMVQVIFKRTGSSFSPDFKTERFELSLEPVRVLGDGEYELGRFLLEQGARLRSYEEYQDFNDLVTEFNTLNPVHIPYACEGGCTLAPFILRLYGKGVFGSEKALPLDLSFSVACLNSSIVSAELIQRYLLAREQGGDGDRGNWYLYQGLGRLYARLVSGGEKRQKPRGMGGKTMID
ncbi:MAG: hypothetical protein HFG71_04180 [Hungatella sp.]|nr:hypothetical protein [Hungatella sp.]